MNTTSTAKNMLTWLSRIFPSSSRSITTRKQPTRTAVEPLEDRIALSTAYVVPLWQPIDSTHQHSLAAALPFVGVNGTVIIEPGATADTNPVNVTLAGVTIKGDPAVGAGSLPRYDLNINASNVTLDNLNLGDVNAANTINHTTITRSELSNFVEQGAASGVGQNTLRHNHITGMVDLQGNSGLFQSTADVVELNDFASSQAVVLELTNSNSTTVKGNHIIASGPSAIGIEVRSGSDAVTITGNTVEATGSGSPIALYLLNTGGVAGNILGAKVLNNTLSTNGTGKGLYCNVFGTGAFMTVQVEGNHFSDNKIGIEINGVPNSTTGAGNIDIGGGSNNFGVSKGGNNFRGFDGKNDHYAIYQHNTDAAITTVAHANIFGDGVVPGTVVRDKTNGGGTGSIDASGPLDAKHAYVQNLYTELLGRVGSDSEIDGLVAQLAKKGNKGVAKTILYSDESLSRIVDHIYSTYLDRDATDIETTKYVKQLKAGVSVARVEANVLGSTEYQSRISSDFVQAVYQDVLNRTATSTEVIAKYKSLQTLGLKGVAASVAVSQERRLNTAIDLYSHLLHRSASTDEANALAAKSGNWLKGELAVLGSDEYFTKG